MSRKIESDARIESSPDRWTGGEDAAWETAGEYVVTRGPKGGLVQIGKALARRGAAAGKASEEQLANARVFAAAPEMLRALRKIVRADRSAQSMPPDGLGFVIDEAAELLARLTEGCG